MADLPTSPTADAAGRERALLRHIVATLAYRGGKTLRGAPRGFGEFRLAPESRSPFEIVAHLGDLLDWAAGMVSGAPAWKPVPPASWEAAVERFYSCLAALDRSLSRQAPLGDQAEKLFQGPLADALTHVGQLAMLRRLAGAPVQGENYYRAKIAAGRVGPDQEPAVIELD